MADSTLPEPDRPSSYCKLLDNIRDRLRPACSDMTSSEFDTLTARMAEIEMKYRGMEILLALTTSDSARPYA